LNAVISLPLVLLLAIPPICALVALFFVLKVARECVSMLSDALSRPVGVVLLPPDTPAADSSVVPGPTGLLRASADDILAANRARELRYDDRAIGDEAERCV
jgi:hypothetical protein